MYTTLHISRNAQRAHVVVDDVTTLPSLFLTIYGLHELSKNSLGTQENILVSLRFFYVYYFKKYKRTFDFDFYNKKYNICPFVDELDGFFHYLLGQQHLNCEEDIQPIGFVSSGLTKRNKVNYGSHVRAVSRYFKYLNQRYMNLKFQDFSPTDASNIHRSNLRKIEDKIKAFNKIKVDDKSPHPYKSITDSQSTQLNNMLLPSTPAFIDAETGEWIEPVINPQNPFSEGFEQFRNYLIHRLMFNYGLRIGEVLLLMKNSVGPTQPDSQGNVRFVLVVHNLPDNVVDPRSRPPSIKTQQSYRQIELTVDDWTTISIYINKYRDPLFAEKAYDDHNILFIKGTGKLSPLSYDAVNTFYKKKIDPAFIKLYSYYRNEKARFIDYLVNLTPHVGRHTWAYTTLRYIYEELLKVSLKMAVDFHIKVRMKGELEPAVEQLRALGGWSVTSTVPLRYANRFIEMVANQSNLDRTARDDKALAMPDAHTSTEDMNHTFDIFDENYDEFL